MKKSKIILASIAICFGTTNVFCQNNTDKQKEEGAQEVKCKFKIVSVYLSNGMSTQKNQRGTVGDFQYLAPQSVLLKQDMQGYSSKNNGRVFGIGIGNGASVGIKFSDKGKTKYNSNPELRIGISYVSATSLSYNLYKSDTKRYDTLTSSQTGQAIYVDSVFNRQYSMSYNSNQIRMDVSLIYRTNPAMRWSVYGGIGINAGAAINTYTEINYYERRSVSGYNAPSHPNGERYGEDGINYSERFTNANSYGYAFYIPMGLDFRLGRKREFFKRLHLYYEAQPTLNVTNILGIGSIATAGIKNNLGLRVSF